MRGAWNTNPSPYVSRFSTNDIPVPSCQSIYMFLKDQTDMSSFLYQASFAPHAAIHGAVGAAFGCDKMEPLLDLGYLSDYDELLTVCRKWSFAMKELFRTGYVAPRTDCSYSSLEESDIDCGYECDRSANTEISAKLRHFVDLQNRLSDEEMSDWRQFVCTGDGYKIFSGDHLESASPADPSFWVIHPTLERLTHAKLMVGGFIDEKWESDKVNEKVCDKASCYISDYGDQDYYEECCYGHYEFDQVLDYVNGNKTNFIGSTNADVFKATDPRFSTYSMTYVYDSFTWDHCSELKSLDFTGLLSNIKDKSTVRK